MKKLKITAYIVLITIVVVIGTTIFVKANEDGQKSQREKALTELKYLDSKIEDIFNEMNNSFIEPIAIGGATYARAFDNCVSFGANMPGNKDMCHQADEFISIDNLMFACKVYAKAIYEISK